MGITTNLFRGSGEGAHRLEVLEGTWPTDMDGWVFIVGPDKREPGGHWFAAHGLLCRIDCAPDAEGRVPVRFARVRTPVERLAQRFPKLFTEVQFAQASPFGVTNLANTNVQQIDGRLFIGYDAGRPIEVDPETLEHVTPVGDNAEWLAAVPGLVEPLVSVAAHPAPAFDEHALYFVNYSALPGDRQTSVARWPLNGPIERWPLVGMDEFDSIHDIKASDDHLVISDLPFIIEPQALRGKPRTKANQEITRLWIVAKDALRRTPPGAPVPVVAVTVPMPTGHLSVDTDDADGVVTVYLEHIPLADLMMKIGPESRRHLDGKPFDPGYEGIIASGVQPGVVGKYRIDAATGEVLESEVVWDDRFWGSVLAAKDDTSFAARARVRDLWYAGIGCDQGLITQEWWDLYGDGALEHVVDPDELPADGRPGALAHFDLESMKVSEVFEFDDGAFPSPPTFVPRTGAEDPGDGYVVVLVHRDGDKQLAVFDAQHIERGPLAVASAPGFNPPLMLHSMYMPVRRGARPSTYRVPLWRDVAQAVRTMPATFVRMVRSGKAAKSMM